MEESTSYSVLPLRIKGLPILRHLYVRPHVGAESERAAFVTGLPACLDEGPLLELFTQFGEVERIALHGTKRSAAVLYAEAAGRDALLHAARKGRLFEVAAPERGQPYGLKAWVEAHKAEKPGNDRLQQALDEWVTAFEEQEERRRAAALAAQQEDGWTVVQRHKGRKRNVGGTGVTVAGVAAAAAQAQAAAKQNPAFGDFYRFQQREKRRNDLLELREKFEADKRRLAELKAARKFKPY